MWASSGTASKALFMSGVEPFQLVQIRVTLAALILALVLGLFARRLLKVRLIDAAYFCFLGGVLLALVQGSYLYTISKMPVAAAILIQYTAPLMVALYSICFWGETAHLSQDCCCFPVASRLLPRGGGIQPGTTEDESSGRTHRLGFGSIVCCLQSFRGSQDAPLPTVDCRVLCFCLCRSHVERP